MKTCCRRPPTAHPALGPQESCPGAPRAIPEPADGLRSHFHCVSVVLLLGPRPIPLIHYWTLHVAHWPLVIAQFWTWQSSFNTMVNNTMHIKQDFTHSKFVSLHWTMKHCLLNTRHIAKSGPANCTQVLHSRQHIVKLHNPFWNCTTYCKIARYIVNCTMYLKITQCNVNNSQCIVKLHNVL